MANEDPSGIPEQVRQTRPFMLTLAAAFVIAVGTFLYILSIDANENDLERTEPPAELVAPPAPAEPAPAEPAASAPAATTPAAPATSN